MQPEIAHVLPWVVAGIFLTVSAIVGILKGYKAFLSEIRQVVGGELRAHTDSEKTWQEQIERRLGEIERKVDELIATTIVQHGRDR